MSDPFFMLMVMRNLEPKYYVWDQQAKIDFVRPGKGTVYLQAKITDADIFDIIENTKNGENPVQAWKFRKIMKFHEIS